LFCLVPYPVALVIGLKGTSSNVIARFAADMVMLICLIVLYGSVLLRHELRHRQDVALLETRVKERTADLEASLAERSIMLREIHHRVKNNLQIITSMLQLEAGSQGEAPSRASLEESVKRIYAMALVHDTLYATEQLDRIDLVAYADKLLDEARAASSINFVLDTGGPIFVGLDFAVPFGLLLNELISNSEEHAFPPGTEGQVDIRIESNGEVTLDFADNGVGISEHIKIEEAKTLGLGLVKILVQQLHGTIDLDREAGTRWTMRFPKPVAPPSAI